MMTRFNAIALIAASALVGACDVRMGNDAGNGDVAGNVSAAGKAEEGQLSVSAPGFEMKLDIPDGVRSRAGIDDENGLIYPGARFSGIHVEGGRDDAQGASEGEVELRFTSSDSPETIARWYRDPARSADFTIASAGREGEDLIVAGTTRDDNGRFTVRLSAKDGGGSDGRVVLADGN
jgi:hypothetical protein